MYVYIYIYIYMHVYAYTCRRTGCTTLCSSGGIHTYIHTHIHIHIHIHIHVHIYKHHIHYTHKHMYTYTHTYICIHTMQNSVLQWRYTNADAHLKLHTYRWTVCQETNNFFGESVLFSSDKRRLATAITGTWCMLFRLTGRDLQRIADK